MKLDLISPRPIAEVALVLEKRFGRMVTYEDVPYIHPDDMIQDKEGRIIPRGGRIIVQYEESENLLEVIGRALELYERSGYPGLFDVEQHADNYHIVPRFFRNVDGTMKERTPLLNTIISLPLQLRNGLQFVEDIVYALSVETGESIVMGMLPINVFIQHASTGNIPNGKARDMLIDLFNEMGLCFSWHLLNTPGKKEFFLNIHQF